MASNELPGLPQDLILHSIAETATFHAQQPFHSLISANVANSGVTTSHAAYAFRSILLIADQSYAVVVPKEEPHVKVTRKLVWTGGWDNKPESMNSTSGIAESKMTVAIALTTFVAGLFYVIIPGPATLAALNLSVTTGHRACASFLACHLLGDLIWASLAICAIIGVSQLGPALFDVLGLVCGLYLIFLGYKAWQISGSRKPVVAGRPWKAGLILGLTNPKAYPFALAMFTAVFARFDEAMTFDNAMPLVLSAFAGFLVATVFVVAWTNLPLTRLLYSRYREGMTKVTAVVFVAFGCKSIMGAIMAIKSRSVE